MKKTTFIILFTFNLLHSFGVNPFLLGTWKGYIISNELDADNRNGLPVTLYINSDNDNGDFVGEMYVSYRYQTDIYNAKYMVKGSLDINTFVLRMSQTEIVYYDVLPKGMSWCFGQFKLNMYQSNYMRKIILDGSMNTECSESNIRVVLVKK